MLAIQRILVPTDFSEMSNRAFDFAVALAQRFSARLIVVHTHHVPTYTFPEGMMPLAPEVLAELERSILAELERLVARARQAGVEAEAKTLLGVPHVEIIRFTREEHIDLIVMGTHGRSGLSHALLGSVADKVVRKAPCPVLTVGPETTTAAHP